MTDEPALIRAILADPADDTVRLAYADWCDENDRPERGEFIRVQCELARPPSLNDSSYPGKMAYLRRRERELLDGSLGLWCAWPNRPTVACLVSPRSTTPPTVIDAIFSRGFVSRVTCSWSDWSQHADAILKAQPVERVTLTTRPGHQGRLGWVGFTAELLSDMWPRIAFGLPPEPPTAPVSHNVGTYENPVWEIIG